MSDIGAYIGTGRSTSIGAGFRPGNTSESQMTFVVTSFFSWNLSFQAKNKFNSHNKNLESTSKNISESHNTQCTKIHKSKKLGAQHLFLNRK